MSAGQAVLEDVTLTVQILLVLIVVVVAVAVIVVPLHVGFLAVQTALQQLVELHAHLHALTVVAVRVISIHAMQTVPVVIVKVHGLAAAHAAVTALGGAEKDVAVAVIVQLAHQVVIMHVMAEMVPVLLVHMDVQLVAQDIAQVIAQVLVKDA